MMRRWLGLLLGLVALALGFLAFLSRHSFVREPREVPTGWQGKALANDTLVLEKWLAKRGWSPRNAGGLLLPSELPAQGTLILLRLHHPLSDVDTEVLLAWVRSGGHLVVDASAAPTNDEKATLALFNRLELTLVKGKDGDQDATGWKVEEDTLDSATYHVRRSRRWRILAGEGWETLGRDDHHVLVGRKEGKGHLSLASDLSFLYNDAFGELDHAAWLEAQLRPIHDKGPVVVWSRPVESALFPWLWSRAWPFLIACGVLLLAWFWRGLFRFGPLLGAPPLARRSLVEHLAASGRFQWAHLGQEHLVKSSREALTRQATRIFRPFPLLSELERRSFLARHSGMDEALVAQALNDRPGASTQDMAHRLQLLQTLRHRLSSQEKPWKP